ncbi:MAG: HNH endonuclease [Dehalococcoidia bacterium]|nr:HNH endonuclease [Dehalococcoidia bacterium]
MNDPVLVLNQGYEPVNICLTRRAVVLVLGGRAEIVENSRGEIHSITRVFEIPSVIRLDKMVHRPRRQRKLTKGEVFNRDRYVCQYCGKKGKDLTLDHIIPRRNGGEHTWENVVSACSSCNRRKGGRTPEEAGMKLLCSPGAPRNNGFYVPFRLLDAHSEWLRYLPFQSRFFDKG